jgi:hypothetical protein
MFAYVYGHGYGILCCAHESSNTGEDFETHVGDTCGDEEDWVLPESSIDLNLPFGKDIKCHVEVPCEVLSPKHVRKEKGKKQIKHKELTFREPYGNEHWGNLP